MSEVATMRTQDELDAVLEAYAMSDGGPSREALERWIQQYPAYERELTELTIDSIQMHHLAPASDAGVVGDDVAHQELLVLHGMSIVQQLLHAQRTSAPGVVRATTADPRPVDDGITTLPESLFRAGADRGLPPDALADATGLSVTLLRALSNRLVVATTVPGEVVDALGRALGYARRTIAEYFTLPATLTAQAAYKADRAPAVPSQRPFADFVREDPELADAGRAALLALCAVDP